MQVSEEMLRAAVDAYHATDDFLVDKIRAALEAALAAMWRPIEEYDKTSGERVIFGIERGNRIDEVHVGYFSWAVNEDEESVSWSEQADDEICPTHFMPLPQPPRHKEG